MFSPNMRVHIYSTECRTLLTLNYIIVMENRNLFYCKQRTDTHTHTAASFYELKFNLDGFGCKSLNILID